MKKKVIVIISILLVFLIGLGAGGYFLLFKTSREPMARILVAENGNGSLLESGRGNLVQIGARLYYSVDTYNNPVKYGVYEISNNGIKRIWWDGIKPLTAMEGYHENLSEYEGELCDIDYITGQINAFDFDKGEFVPVEGAFCEDSSLQSEYQQFQTENDSAVQVASLFAIDYYIVDRNGAPVLYVNHPKESEDRVIYDFGKEYPHAVCLNIYSKANCLYVEFYTDEGIMGLEYYPERDEVLVIPPEDYAGTPLSDTLKVYANNPHPYEEGDPAVGIFVTDTETGEKTRVYDGSVRDMYIFDSNWIYFSLEDRTLWRVSPDGGVLEQVF